MILSFQSIHVLFSITGLYTGKGTQTLLSWTQEQSVNRLPQTGEFHVPASVPGGPSPRGQLPLDNGAQM